ncbi:BgTH12-07799 [Blumeria graminis f. sp. triticale]|uniref:BgtE-20030 n=3 Tax=Blumeria graminis TaxID=34373 RepID=A0A381LC49_BLUGR|nr:BgTH12-07799 [Blumeria graminis f. sp. triticale]VDB96430.1 BgtE-20030 [Blumeria graminis f. sp. tritici]
MKFLSAASTAALVGLLVLMPAAHGEPYFKCSEGHHFTISEAENERKFCHELNALSGDPLGPNGEVLKTSRSRRYRNDGSSIAYILQLIDLAPFFRVYEKPYSVWEQCIYHDET